MFYNTIRFIVFAFVSLLHSPTITIHMKNFVILFCNCSILFSHVHGIGHANVHQNKLILLMCNGGIEEIDFTAEGGVVAGDLAMKLLQLQCKCVLFVAIVVVVVKCQ